MRPVAIIFAVTTLAIGALVAWFIAIQTVNWIETSQKNEIEQALFAGGIDWIEISTDGLQVVVTGQALTVSENQRAMQIVSMIVFDGLEDRTSVVDAEIEGVQTAELYLEILKNGSAISLIGVVEDDEAFDSLLLALNEKPGVEVTDLTTKVSVGRSAEWQQAVSFASRIVSLTERSILTIRPGHVQVNTVAGSSEWQDGLEDLLINMRPELVTLDINITAPRQIISPYRFQMDGAGANPVVCSARNESEAAELNDTFLSLGIDAMQCNVGLGAPSDDWNEIVVLCAEVLTSIGAGTISIENTDIRLDVAAGVNPELLAIFTNKIPREYSLQISVAPEISPADPVEEVIAARFIATLDPDGTAVMEGTFKDDLNKAAVLRYGEAKFGYGLVEDDFVLTTQLPDRWQVRIFAAIEALALLESGQVAVTEDMVALTGIASFEDPEMELLTLFNEAIGAGIEIELDITYTPKEDIAENALDPRICISRISTLLTDNQISFAPSSAVIEDLSTPTIEAIAAILTQCQGARFEIGGHTDSQGREEMNKNLSQSRANAVLDGLVAQNLLLGDVVAVGYGESQPIADNGTEEGRAENRRIEFTLIRESEIAQEEASDE